MYTYLVNNWKCSSLAFRVGTNRATRCGYDVCSALTNGEASLVVGQRRRPPSLIIRDCAAHPEPPFGPPVPPANRLD